MKNWVVGSWLVLAAVLPSVAQTKNFVGIAKVATSGTMKGNEYRNSFLGITISAPKATLTLNPAIQVSAQRGRLVEATTANATWDNTYTLAVLADSLAVNPLIKSPDDYVRSVRHALEHEGSVTVKAEFPIIIAGVNFTGAIVQMQVNNREYYRGIYTTFRKGYIVSFDVEAPSQERLNEIVTTFVKFDNQ